MKILLCHNFYQQAGGEDRVFADETALLRDYGHDVVQYTVHNDAIHQMSHWNVAWRTLWNPATAREVGRLIDEHRPDVMHCTNAFPLLSPAIYYAARRRGVAVVQSLHNYRMLCLNSLFLRDSRPCEDCFGRSVAWPGIVHRCYRNSMAGSTVVAALQASHRWAGTWRRAVDLYTACSEYSRDKFIAAGLPAEKIVTRHNFVYPDPGVGRGDGDFALFVGRLSEEKGVHVLLQAWRRMPDDLPLTIVGDGPMRPEVEQAAASLKNVRWLGRLPSHEVAQLMSQARVLILPSICYENGPKALLEAYAQGLPVIATQLGAIADAVYEGRTGMLFKFADDANLAQQVVRFWGDAELQARLRTGARAEFDAHYAPEAAHRNLIACYRRAIASRGGACPKAVEPRAAASAHPTLSQIEQSESAEDAAEPQEIIS